MTLFKAVLRRIADLENDIAFEKGDPQGLRAQLEHRINHATRILKALGVPVKGAPQEARDE